MMKTIRVPITMLALASMFLVPTFFASAREGGKGLGEGPRPPRSPVVAFEVVSITDNGDGSGTISATFERVQARLTEEQGIVQGDAIEINYTSETVFIENYKPSTVQFLTAGEIAFALGLMDFENMTLRASRIVDEPFPPKFHMGKVAKVDTEANTILVKSLRPNEENGEYQFVLVTYNQDTDFTEDHEEADESALTVGDRIHLRGTINWESEEYIAEINADQVVLFDEELPPRPAQGRPGQPAS